MRINVVGVLLVPAFLWSLLLVGGIEAATWHPVDWPSSDVSCEWLPTDTAHYGRVNDYDGATTGLLITATTDCTDTFGTTSNGTSAYILMRAWTTGAIGTGRLTAHYKLSGGTYVLAWYIDMYERCPDTYLYNSSAISVSNLANLRVTWDETSGDPVCKVDEFFTANWY